ncbi:MAG: hypothetical protein AAGB31_11400 [Bdellovibrio sp.]
MKFYPLILVLMWATTSQAAASCLCKADPYSKKYITFAKTWYGTKRKWTCVYTCQNSRQESVQILGTHQNWYLTDRGLEGICDGLEYVNEYNTYRNDFVWVFKKAQWFNPESSTAQDVKAWAQETCRE